MPAVAVTWVSPYTIEKAAPTPTFMPSSEVAEVAASPSSGSSPFTMETSISLTSPSGMVKLYTNSFSDLETSVNAFSFPVPEPSPFSSTSWVLPSLSV